MGTPSSQKKGQEAVQLSPLLLQEYEYELDRLRQENNEIRMVKDLRERDFENVMFENAQLQNKLENLENVFIGSAIQRDNRIRTPKVDAMGNPIHDGLSQDYATSNLMIENNDLKKRIFNLEQEKIELQQALQQYSMN
jgi:hypothetical protein